MENKFPVMGKTYKGMEDILASELKNLGAENIEVGNRAVSFTADRAMLYRANLWSRVATRFLVPVVSFEAHDAEELYDKAKSIDWSEYLDPEMTFAISSTVYSDEFTHSMYVAYRVKDAIVDQFNEKTGKRPSVSLTNADLQINVHVAATTCTISLDSTGESLHKRGYREEQNEAPVSEALAAGMLLMAGWDGSTDFVDPMCGSGTILIEAALIALNIPPGIFRAGFAFEKWKDFDVELFDEIYNDDSQEREFANVIYGSDSSRQAIRIAEQNSKRAGVSKYIKLTNSLFQDLETLPQNALMVTNPPYGERLKVDDMRDLYGDFGRMLKQKFVGSTAWVISSNDEYMACIGMKPSEKIKLMNAELDCLFCKYEVFEGKRNDYVREQVEKGIYKNADERRKEKRESGDRFKRTEKGHFEFEKDIKTDEGEERQRRDFHRRPKDGRGRRDDDRRYERKSFDRNDRRGRDDKSEDKRSYSRSFRDPDKQGDNSGYRRRDNSGFKRRDDSDFRKRDDSGFKKKDSKPFRGRDDRKRDEHRRDGRGGNEKRFDKGKPRFRNSDR